MTSKRIAPFAQLVEQLTLNFAYGECGIWSGTDTTRLYAIEPM